MRRRELLKSAAASVLPKNPLNAVASVLNSTGKSLLNNVNLSRNPRLIGSAEEISGALSGMFDIQGFNPRYMRKVDGKIVVKYGDNEWFGNFIPEGVYDPEYLAANWFNTYIKKLRSTGSLEVLFREMFGDGSVEADDWLDGAVSKFARNLVDFLSPQTLERYVRKACSYGGDLSQEDYLSTLQNIGNLSPIFAKAFPGRVLEDLRSVSFDEFEDYLRRFKNIDIRPDDFSGDDVLASTHGGFGRGESHFYDRGRVFECVNARTGAYRLLVDSLS